jgi:hypothetical protein
VLTANSRRAILAVLLSLHGVHLPAMTGRGAALLAAMQPSTTTGEPGKRAWVSGTSAASSTGFPAAPLRFEPNIGQAEARVDAVARGDGYTLYLERGNAVLALRHATDRRLDQRAFALTLVGANPRAKASYVGAQPGVTNYLIGSDRAKWRTGLRTYARVEYSQVYPGIDLVYYGNPRHLEHDFVVAPGADPSIIALRFDGAREMRLDSTGDLVLSMAGSEIHQKRPVMYQPTSAGDRHHVTGRYVVDGSIVRFDVGEYDAQRPLVIDPVTLIYSTYLGGTAAELAVDVASDAAGSAYILGLSESLEYPTVNALQGTHAGGSRSPAPGDPPWVANNVDLVLSKLTPDGQAFEYSTYLGGPSNDRAFALAVSATGEVFIAGALPGGLPAVGGYEHACPCDEGFYVAKLNASATEFMYVAKFGITVGFGTADLGVDASGNAVVLGAGMTFKLNAAGSGLVYAIGVGGTAIAVAPDGSAAMTGSTNSIDFPTVAPFQEALHGKFDAFVRGVSPEGIVRFATYLGGLGDDRGNAIAIDSSGSIYVTGTTASLDFPNYRASQPRPGGNGREDMFVTKISQTGALLYSTYLGGGYVDMGVGITLDAQQRPYVVGRTYYTTVPDFWPGAYPEFWDSRWDVSVTKLDASLAPLHSILFGGFYNDQPVGVAIGPDDSVYIGGTSYGGIPLKNPIQQWSFSIITHHGEPHSVNMFLARIALKMTVSSADPAVVAADRPARVIVTGNDFQPGAQVLIGGEWATGVVVNSSTSLSAMVPALPAGVYDVVVIAPDGERASLPDALMYGTCSFVVPDSPQMFLGSGGSRAVPVTAVAERCRWRAASTVDWITVAPSAGTGSGGVLMTVAANGTNRSRSGVVTIAEQPIIVTQAPSEKTDLNLDGWSDLLWQHQTEGWVAAWLVDNWLQCLEGTLLSPAQVPDLQWKIAGAGDFDGDGRSDLVWQHADGRLTAWLMNGVIATAGVSLTPSQVADIDWRIAAVGDLDTDGQPDLIWQHRTDGRIAVWFMDGLRMLEGRLLVPSMVVDIEWKIVGAGDFTGDGRLDLVWEHQTDGRLAIWEMQGPTLASGRVHARIDSGPSADVKVRAVGDFDADGHLDLMAQHVGGRDLRFCKNTPVGSDDFVFVCNLAPTPDSVADTNWRMAGPR